jgi:hypothetical protein
MVDGQLAAGLTAALAFGALAIGRGGREALLGAAASAAVCCNLKFTGAAYCGALVGLLWPAIALVRDRPLRRRVAALAAAASAATALAVVGAGWNPYVTNTIRHGHPFHPVKGPSSPASWTRGNGPDSFVEMNRVERLARSIFSESRTDAQEPRLKLPFTVTSREPGGFWHEGPRIGGFGPLFGGALLLAAFLVVRGVARRSLALAAGPPAILAWALLNSEAWWARFAPQVWLAAVVALPIAWSARAARLDRVVSWVLVVTLAANAALVGAKAIHRRKRSSREVAHQLSELARERRPIAVRFGEFRPLQVRLREAGVPFVAVDELPCASPRSLAWSWRVEFCAEPRLTGDAGPAAR